MKKKHPIHITVLIFRNNLINILESLSPDHCSNNCFQSLFTARKVSLITQDLS